MRNNEPTPFFSNHQLEREFRRTIQRRKRRVAFVKSVFFLLALSIVVVLISNLWFPVYQITGNSMNPTLEQGMTVIASRISEFSACDVVSIQYGNCVLISRLIGMPCDEVQIDENGVVSINDMILREDYLTVLDSGSTDLIYPFHVPDQHYFIMGDNRPESRDSRMSAIGCIEETALDGKIVFCIWPLHRFGFIE